MEFSYKDLKEYNDEYIINGVDQICADRVDPTSAEMQIIQQLWDFATAEWENIETHLYAIPEHDLAINNIITKCCYYTEQVYMVYEYITSLSKEEQVTLTLLGVCV